MHFSRGREKWDYLHPESRSQSPDLGQRTPGLIHAPLRGARRSAIRNSHSAFLEALIRTLLGWGGSGDRLFFRQFSPRSKVCLRCAPRRSGRGARSNVTALHRRLAMQLSKTATRWLVLRRSFSWLVYLLWTYQWPRLFAPSSRPRARPRSHPSVARRGCAWVGSGAVLETVFLNFRGSFGCGNFEFEDERDEKPPENTCPRDDCN
jgi:hypothetical protein